MDRISIDFDKEKWHPVIRAGIYPQWDDVNKKIVHVEITVDDLIELAKNYDAAYSPAPLWIGHPPYDSPALAWIGNFEVSGSELGCRFSEVSPEAVYLTESGKYKKVSIEIDRQCQLPGGKVGQYPIAIGLTNSPIVKSLPDLKFSHAGKEIKLSNENEILVSENPLIIKSLNNNKMNLSEAVKKFAASIGLNVNEFNSDTAVLEKAAEVIGKLKDQFSDNPEIISSLDLYVSKFSAMPGRIKELESSVEKYENEKSEILIQGAIDSNKILPAEKDEYVKLAKSNYESTKNILLSRKSMDMFDQNKVTENNSPAGTGDEKAKWSFSKWSEEDPNGLKNMKINNFSAFKELFKKEYNEEYSE